VSVLREHDNALLFRVLATLRTDVPVFDDVEELRWTGPTPAFPPIAAAFDAAVTDNKAVKKPRSQSQ
jgi:hypothetical protein